MTKDAEQREQHQRFVETARKLGCDEDPEAFEQAVRQVVRPQKGGLMPSNQREKRGSRSRSKQR